MAVREHLAERRRGSSIQAESSGMSTYAHEFSHILGIGDNYNNPYSVPARRAYSGPVGDARPRRSTARRPAQPVAYPADWGASMGFEPERANRMEPGSSTRTTSLRLDRNELDDSGLVVARVTARWPTQGPAGPTGFSTSSFSLAYPRVPYARRPVARVHPNTDPFCPGPTVNSSGVIQHRLYNNYTAEVVDRLGADLFTPVTGVPLLEDEETRTASPFEKSTSWTPIPEDMNKVDFVWPDGTPSMVTTDRRAALNDATVPRRSRLVEPA